MNANANPVAKDFEDRESLDRVRAHVARIRDFVATFEEVTRSQTNLAQQKLDRLQRKLEHVNAACKRHEDSVGKGAGE